MTNSTGIFEKKKALLKELASLNHIVCGSFFERTLNGKPRFILSRMRQGKQRQIYVAQRHAQAVADGVKEYERALEILGELGELTMQTIKNGER
jgi:hypothetical protein